MEHHQVNKFSHNRSAWGKEMEKSTENLFNKIIAEKFPGIDRVMNIRIQEVKRSSIIFNPKNYLWGIL